MNNNLDEIRIYINEHDIETNRGAMIMVIEECLDGQDNEEKKTVENKKL